MVCKLMLKAPTPPHPTPPHIHAAGQIILHVYGGAIN